MENRFHIIEGMLYLRGDEGIDINDISAVLEISKKEATVIMDEFAQCVHTYRSVLLLQTP